MLKQVGVLIFGLLLGLLATETAVRIYLRMSVPPPAWSDRPKFYFAPDDSRTLQDYVYNPVKAPGTFRIAVVGDSYSFAPYMQFTDTFPKKLETMLRVNRHEPPAEVINYGVPAYSTSHEVAVVQRALKEQADLILLQITLNDPELKPYRPTGIGANDRDRFGDLAPRGWQKTVFRYWKTAEIVVRRLHNTRTHQAYADYFNDLFEKKKTWRNFNESLRQIVQLSRDAKVPVAAVVFPLFGLPLDQRYPFHGIHQKTAGLLNELEVPNVDLYKLYEGIPLDRLQVIPIKDRHPNEIAHRMAAEEIYLWLLRVKLIPDAFKIGNVYQQRLGIANQPRADGLYEQKQ